MMWTTCSKFSVVLGLISMQPISNPIVQIFLNYLFEINLQTNKKLIWRIDLPIVKTNLSIIKIEFLWEEKFLKIGFTPNYATPFVKEMNSANEKTKA